MHRFALAATLSCLLAAPALAQQPVEVTSLAAPDAFTTPGRDTGLPQDLWRGATAATAQAVLPLLATKPLSPAAAYLGRRLLATGAPGPAGAPDTAALTGARANALIALGDVAAANRILERAPGLDRSADLSRAAAESALLAGNDPGACSIAQNLGVDRGEAYWLRLRAFCQAQAGRTDQAQLTFDLAQVQAKDAVYARLMAAKLSGAAPGAASLRNGLDYALVRSLKLDPATAKPAPAVAAALSGAEPAAPSFDVSAADAATGGIGSAIAGGPLPAGGLDALVLAAADADAKTRGRLQSAALLAAGLVPELPAEHRARIAAFAVPEGKASAGRNLALADAVARKLKGETGLIALWICADAGAAGPAVADRARIVRALSQVGLTDEARTFALEGLAGLK